MAESACLAAWAAPGEAEDGEHWLRLNLPQTQELGVLLVLPGKAAFGAVEHRDSKKCCSELVQIRQMLGSCSDT